MLRALGKNILVKKIVPEKKPSLVITNLPTDEPYQASFVNKGAAVELDIKEGDVLLLVPYCGSKISKEDDGYLLISERDILGVVE